MHFLCDENIPGASVRALRASGHNVVYVAEETPGASDQTVLERASRENRVIVTFDRDYGELIFRASAPLPTGVLYLRFMPRSPDEPAELILRLLAQGSIDLAGYFTVLSPPLVRQRRLSRD